MIFCFSGTGNSRYIANKIAETLGKQTVSLNEKVRNKDFSPIECDEKIIFVTPTYAWRMPLVVEEFIKKTNFNGAKRAWFVMTCGGEIGDAEKYNKALCESKNLTYMGTYQVVMPENYIAMFGVPTEEESVKIIESSEKETDRISAMISKNTKFPKPRSNAYDKIMSSAVNPIFYKFFVKDKQFYATDECVSCGKCVEICPLENIKIKDGKPKWNGDCTHCMACISYCPKEAIEYGKKSKGKRRYHI